MGAALQKTTADEDNPNHRGVLLPKRTIELLEDRRQETPFPEEDSLILNGEESHRPSL